MFAEIVAEYKYLQDNLGKLVSASDMSIDEVAKNLNMDAILLQSKIDHHLLSPDEIEKLLDVIKADELEDKVLLESSLENEKDSETIRLHG
ncbi:MAG: hypothetical protein AAGC88_12855 [Bacteroidota bacterium]